MKENDLIAAADVDEANTAASIVYHKSIFLDQVSPATKLKNLEAIIDKLTFSIREPCQVVPGESSLQGIGLAAQAAKSREETIRNPANLQ